MMNDYFDALRQLENKIEELGLLLDDSRYPEVLKKINEIEVQLIRIRNYAWGQSGSEGE